ncbi:MAG: GNAT family N-acetyltransferase [Dehalococcoidia bacterium]|nr:GNAT family N-acetyltransferase [Dehalococcoidia bacterium]
MNIRNAGMDELDQVAEVITDAYGQYAALMGPEHWEMYRRNLVDLQSRLDRSALIVAVENGRILGAVTFFPNGSASEGAGWPEGYTGIRILAVHHDARSRGLGRALTEECIRRSRDLGARHVGLHTTEFMSVARAMYLRMGFERVPEFDFHPVPEITVEAYRLTL